MVVSSNRRRRLLRERASRASRLPPIVLKLPLTSLPGVDRAVRIPTAAPATGFQFGSTRPFLFFASWRVAAATRREVEQSTYVHGSRAATALYRMLGAMVPARIERAVTGAIFATPYRRLPADIVYPAMRPIRCSDFDLAAVRSGRLPGGSTARTGRGDFATVARRPPPW